MRREFGGGTVGADNPNLGKADATIYTLRQKGPKLTNMNRNVTAMGTQSLNHSTELKAKQLIDSPATDDKLHQRKQSPFENKATSPTSGSWDLQMTPQKLGQDWLPIHKPDFCFPIFQNRLPYEKSNSTNCIFSSAHPYRAFCFHPRDNKANFALKEIINWGEAEKRTGIYNPFFFFEVGRGK